MNLGAATRNPKEGTVKCCVRCKSRNLVPGRAVFGSLVFLCKDCKWHSYSYVGESIMAVSGRRLSLAELIDITYEEKAHVCLKEDDPSEHSTKSPVGS